MDDREIVELFWKRSEQAITQLNAKYGAAVRQVAHSILKDPQDAEECVNDTYFQLWKSIPPQCPQYLGAYACKTARNISLKRYTYNSAYRRNSFYDAALDELAECIPDLAEVESEYQAKALAEAINRFLKRISKQDRWLFVQRYWLGVTVSQISRSSNMTAHAVSVRLFRIRNRLRKYLMKEGVAL